MRPGTLFLALAFGAGLLAPSVAEADRNRSPERGRRSGYDRSPRSHGRYERGRPGHSYRRDHSRHAYKRGHYRPSRRHHRPYSRPRPPGHYRPHYRPYSHRPYPRRYYAPYPVAYGPAGPLYGGHPPYRGGVHGSVAIGLPFFGLSLHF